MSDNERILEVEVNQLDGFAFLKLVPEKHGWSIETLVENSREYTGEGVESVTAEANCFVHDPGSLRDLANRLLEKADEMDRNQARGGNQ